MGPKGSWGRTRVRHDLATGQQRQINEVLVVQW